MVGGIRTLLGVGGQYSLGDRPAVLKEREGVTAHRRYLTALGVGAALGLANDGS